MTMFAQECYGKFNWISLNHFENTQWTLKNDYKSNVVRVWQKINEYYGITSVYQQIMQAICNLAALFARFVAAFTLIYLIIMFNSDYLWDSYFLGQNVYFNVLVLLACYIMYFITLYLRKRTLGRHFEEVKDLVRGTVFTDRTDTWQAYKHFKTLKGVRIIEIKDMYTVLELQNITVIFVFEERFIGEMQFRFNKDVKTYNANHFIYEIARSKMKLEVVQTLSRRAIWLSENNGMECLPTVNEQVSEDEVSDDDYGITDEEFYNMPLYKNAVVLNESTHSDIIASRKSAQDLQDI